MVGLSMGGMETHRVTLNNPDLFGYYGLLSGGIYTADELAGQTEPELIFIGTGSKENPDRVKDAVASLKEAGFKAVSYVSDGTANEFKTWRRCLYQLAPLLFR